MNWYFMRALLPIFINRLFDIFKKLHEVASKMYFNLLFQSVILLVVKEVTNFFFHVYTALLLVGTADLQNELHCCPRPFV